MASAAPLAHNQAANLPATSQGGMEELLPLVKQLTNPDQVRGDWRIIRRSNILLALKGLYDLAYYNVLQGNCCLHIP